MTRIGASATGLLRDTVLQPSPATLTGGLSSMVNNGKGEGESNTGPSQAVSQSWSTNLRSSRGQERNQANQDMQGASPHSPFGSQCASMITQHLPPNSLLASIDGSPEYPEFHGSADHVGGLNSAEFEDVWNHKNRDQSTMVGGLQGHDDGAAVVALLSSASFSADDESAASWNLLYDESVAVSSMLQGNREYVACESHDLDLEGQSFKNTRSLVPDWMLDRGSSSESPSILAATMLHTDESYMCSTRDMESLVAQTEPWLKFLTSYQDEVWGDHLPLIREARKELQDLRNGEHEATTRGQPALRRLEMILGHLDIRPEIRVTTEQSDLPQF